MTSPSGSVVVNGFGHSDPFAEAVVYAHGLKFVAPDDGMSVL